MKTCSYCGKGYSDDMTVCPADGQDLDEMKRENVTGVWRGVYGYGERAGKEPVTFTLNLKQGLTQYFTGSVTEDAPYGMPGTGKIEGHFEMSRIEFNKQMPVGYIRGTDGVRQTLREYYAAKGHPCDHEIPSSIISYRGGFLDSDRVQGVWTIPPHRVQFQDGSAYFPSRVSGFWCAQFMGADSTETPPGGPTEPLFDKSLITQDDLEEIENPARERLGLYSVLDAERIIDRFAKEKIRFDLGSDDAAFYRRNAVMLTLLYPGRLSAAPMILLFVHPEDMARAEAVVAEDQKV